MSVSQPQQSRRDHVLFKEIIKADGRNMQPVGSVSIKEAIMLIKVRDMIQFQELIKEHREKGYNLITLGKKLAELEKDNQKVVITIKRKENKA